MTKDDKLKLERKVAIITGAGRGIGQTIAQEFASQGARLFLAARTRDELEETSVICNNLGVETNIVVTDISKRDQAQNLVTTTIRIAGKVDILVNCAGVYGPIGPLTEVDLSHWERAVAINLFGPLYLCQSLIPYLKNQGQGKIILFSGGGATTPLPNISSYAASKAGLVRLADTIAEELMSFNVQVNVIAPGLVDTELQNDVLDASHRAGPYYEKIKKARETGEGAVSPQLAADLAVFLASDDSGSLTGKLISAPHDPWSEWVDKGDELNATQMYTIRRLDPFTIKPLVKEIGRFSHSTAK